MCWDSDCDSLISAAGVSVCHRYAMWSRDAAEVWQENMEFHWKLHRLSLQRQVLDVSLAYFHRASHLSSLNNVYGVSQSLVIGD